MKQAARKSHQEESGGLWLQLTVTATHVNLNDKEMDYLVCPEVQRRVGPSAACQRPTSRLSVMLLFPPPTMCWFLPQAGSKMAAWRWLQDDHRSVKCVCRRVQQRKWALFLGFQPKKSQEYIFLISSSTLSSYLAHVPTTTQILLNNNCLTM